VAPHPKATHLTSANWGAVASHDNTRNALICLQFGHTQSILIGDSQGHDSFTEDTLLSMSDKLPLVLTLNNSEEHRSREQPTIVRDAGLHVATAMSFGPSQSEHAISFNTSCRHCQSHSKAYDWHADSSRGTIVERSGERIAPRDLEPNLSQMLHSVQFISNLVLFIYKQLKRPVAFSAVHFDVKPQIVTLQNNVFYLNFI